TVVATSSTEAEYVAIATCCAQVLWIQNQLLDYGSMTRMVQEQGGLTQINDEDFYTYMFACFLSQKEPKRVHQAFKDPSWIEAMQEELLEFKMQKGHTREEGIDYEEFFAPVARIEAKVLFFMEPLKKKSMFVNLQHLKTLLILIRFIKWSKHSMGCIKLLELGMSGSSGSYTMERPILYVYLTWNEFSSSMASAVIYLATDDISSHNTKYTSPTLTQKVLANIRRIGKGFFEVETPLFDAMLVQQQVHDDAEVQEDEDNKVPDAPTPPSPTPATTPPSPQREPIPSPPQAKSAQPLSPLLALVPKTALLCLTRRTMFHGRLIFSDDELTEKELKQIKADDQAIQTILLGLPEDIYAAVDSCETAQEIWLRVQQMMKGSEIGIQEKKAKLFNEWEKFTSTDGESIESYYHHLLKLMNDLKRNKHFPEKITSNLKFLNNLQLEWSRHVTIVHETKDLHTVDYTQLYDFLKYNQKKVDELKAERLARTQDPLALMATSNNPYTFLADCLTGDECGSRQTDANGWRN
nr:Gag-Pol polyprotein [Tanacetum cinerariifolium]